MDDATPEAGREVTFTVTVTNAGPDAATGVSILDPVPAGLSLVSDDAGAGSYDAATGEWQVGTIAAGGSATLTLAVEVGGPSAFANTATLQGVNQYDDAESAPTSVTVTPQSSDLSITETVDDARPEAQQVETFTITVANSGPDDATGVAVSVPLPAGLTYVSSSAEDGSYDEATGLWGVGTLGASGSETLTILARATSAALSEVTATITGLDQYDPTDDDDTTTVSVSPMGADISVSIDGMPTSGTVGQSFDVRITVSNGGPDASAGVSLPISVPPGFQLISADPGQGTFDPTTGLWDVGTVGADGSSVLELELVPIASGPAELSAGPRRARRSSCPTPARRRRPSR